MTDTRKVDVIKSCEDCSNVYWYLGTTPCCCLNNNKMCWEGIPENQEIPNWCPLPDAEEET